MRALAAELRTLPAVLESTLVVLRTGGPEAPLVLLHGNRGHALHYAGLVRVAGADAPIWALEHRGSEARSIDDMASRHLRTLLKANPTGPYLLAGFCYGAVVAHELACRLVNAGHDVALLALLGITPLEYPRVVSTDALKAWRRTHGPAASHVESAPASQADTRPAGARTSTPRRPYGRQPRGSDYERSE